MTPTKALDCYTNSPSQHLRKYIENSTENMHNDIRVRGLILMNEPSSPAICDSPIVVFQARQD